MGKVTIGIKKLEYGAVQEDGSPATSLTEIHSLQDTLTFNEPTSTDTEINIDQSDDPVFSRSTKGPLTFTFSIPDADNDTIAAFCGGTVTDGSAGDSYSPATSVSSIHMTIRITPDEGYVRTYNDCTINAFETGTQGKTNAISLVVNCTVNKPKDGTSPTFTRESSDYVAA